MALTISVFDSSTVTENVLVRPSTTVYLTANQTWVAPPDFNPFNNTVEAIGGGGAGANGGPSPQGGAGGGAGAYSKAINANIQPGDSLTVVVGTGGAGDGGAGGNGTDSSVVDGATTIVLAKGGTGGPLTSLGAQGGQASGGTGDVKHSGGNGGNANFSVSGGGGGGGAAGPLGDGGNGGNADSLVGGGGGGNGGGTNGHTAVNPNGGNGGDNHAGTGHGANGTDASNGGGGAGAGGPSASNQKGSNGIDFDATHGSGGGSGGGDHAGNPTSTAGNYGAASGGSGGAGGTPSNGAPGIIVISWNPAEIVQVNDSVTVTENVNLSKVFTLSVSDSSTVTESVSLNAFTVQSFSVFDSSTVTENVVLNIIGGTLLISVFDPNPGGTVAVTDAAFIGPPGTFAPSWVESWDYPGDGVAGAFHQWNGTGTQVTGRYGFGGQSTTVFSPFFYTKSAFLGILGFALRFSNSGGNTFGDTILSCGDPNDNLSFSVIMKSLFDGRFKLEFQVGPGSTIGPADQELIEPVGSGGATPLGTVGPNIGYVNNLGEWAYYEIGLVPSIVVTPATNGNPGERDVVCSVDTFVRVDNVFVWWRKLVVAGINIPVANIPVPTFTQLLLVRPQGTFTVDDMYMTPFTTYTFADFLGDCKANSDDATVFVDPLTAPLQTQVVQEIQALQPVDPFFTQVVGEINANQPVEPLFTQVVMEVAYKRVLGYIASQGKWIQS